MFWVFIILVLYGSLIFSYLVGWNNTAAYYSKQYSLSVSVIVAMKDEAKNIKNLYKNLILQSYPKEKIEIIFVNDHSKDNTLELLKEIEGNNIHCLNMPENSYGKKKSIKKAAELASGDIIIVTDADCTFSYDWIRTMIDCFGNDKIKLVSGPVTYKKKRGLFNSFQSLEFLSLVGSGAGSIGSGNSIFCNGANMAYRKDIFLELNTYDDDNAASGDDVFLLHQIKKHYPKGIIFIKDPRAIVSTIGSETYYEFYNQRKRWASKSTSYRDMATIYVSLLVFLTNFLMLFLFLLCLYDLSMMFWFGIFICCKFIIDLIFLIPVLRFFGRNDLVKFIFPFELFYSFYIVFIVVLSFVRPFNWKGRVYSK